MNLLTFSKTQDTLMWDTWMSIYQSAVVTVADEISLFSCLKHKHIGDIELANKLSISQRAIEVLGKVLICLGFLARRNGKFALTPISKTYLLPDSPFYWGAQLKGMRQRNEHMQILEAIKHETNVLSYGSKTFTDMWESGAITKKAAYEFTEKMHATIFASAVGAVNTGIFRSTKRLLDMGGGSGCFSIAFTKKHPKSSATIFELPPVCEVANRYIKQFDLSNKISIYSGNFFKDEWPKGYDGILFSQILHDWPIEHCRKLIKYAHEALLPGGKIFIHEMLLNEDKTSPLATACFDLLMFINHKSQQFTKKELHHLLKNSGFKNILIKNTFGYYSTTVATKEEKDGSTKK